jgi:hypothetical protein
LSVLRIVELWVTEQRHVVSTFNEDHLRYIL